MYVDVRLNPILKVRVQITDILCLLSGASLQFKPEKPWRWSKVTAWALLVNATCLCSFATARSHLLIHNDTYPRIVFVLDLATMGSGPRRPSTASWTHVLYITSIAFD